MTLMTEKSIREEWDSHSGDTLPKDELDKAYRSIAAKAAAVEAATLRISNGSSRRRVLRSVSIGVAASFILLALPFAGAGIYRTIEKESGDGPLAAVQEAPQLREESTRNGETRDIVLPDGTTVHLNAGSVIIYPDKFSSSLRSVYLSGEAVFEVTHSDESPFVVTTSDLEISVHGTVFNVNSYPESATAAATLCEGSISARVKGGAEDILLVPNQRLSLRRENGQASVSAVNASEDTAWMRGDMCFRSESIHTILKAIERKYGINAYVTSGKYDSVLLTAKFIHGESLDKMLQSICRLVPGMRYEIVSGSVYIR